MQSLAFFLPALWLPSFTRAIGLPKFSGPLGLALISLATCFGAILVGLLVDRFDVSVAIMISTLGQMIALFVFWGLTNSQPMLYVFAVVWDLFGGGFSATFSGYTTAMNKRSRNSHIDTGLIVSLMAAGRGVGAVISGPLSEWLLEHGWKSHAGFAYGTAYGILIVFSGFTAMLGGAGCLGRIFRLVGGG